MLPKIAFGHKKTAFSQAPKPQTAFLRSQPDSAHRFFSSLLGCTQRSERITSSNLTKYHGQSELDRTQRLTLLPKQCWRINAFDRMVTHYS